ncbi:MULTISPECIES: ArpU family phage packaging/lysis transcriptional regulator [Bacillus]|uniref:ArpU family phage packaging/lysis transcriptional regulator n=1 Tax=Bacillus TaxID=1386 RepID=UPI0005DF39D8|nr:MULTISPECIES: ArpU family phage packaging/lysis transcriptional regulator [Bacillus]MCA1017148.1 ArpU family transcriptional regulator [Bacillus stratosphericus]KJF45770.1 ArpU family transcriptional regulator [Bacillus altitudinis]MBU8652886.1 ArpU family transcriptional regulator [Bacillus altitudinis]MBU8777920.1 ArpU family transcriptional regulator [Bacillus altitudinis]MCY7496536.1 ArpU family transcriptional regulator [Bacillus altitudinis]
MTVEVLHLLPEVNEKQVRQTLINELKLYKALKVKQENLDEQKANGILTLFPKLKDQNVCSELKVRQIERALEYSLDEIEQDIIRMKYLTSRMVKDLEVCEELGLKKDRYYKLKKQATFKLSTALGII